MQAPEYNYSIRLLRLFRSTGILFDNVVGDLNTRQNEQFDIVGQFP